MGAYSSTIQFFEDVAKSLSDSYEFGHGAAGDFNSIKDKSYPYIWLDPLDGGFPDGPDTKISSLIQFNVTLNFLKLDEKDGNEKETLKIWDETFTVMQKYIHKLDEFSLGVSDSDTLTIKGSKFTPRRKVTDDCVSGWTLSFQLEVKSTFDYCSIYET